MTHPMPADRLRDLCASYGLITGVCMSPSDLNNEKFRALARQHFVSVTMTNEMKAYSLLDREASMRSPDSMPVMDYVLADRMVAFCRENGLLVRGHVLVWDAFMRDWFFRQGYDPENPYADRETVRYRTAYYIDQVIRHFEENFPGTVYCWDVVNEAVGDTAQEYLPGDPRHVRTVRGGNQDNLFRAHLGDDYVEFAFLCARNTVDALGKDIKLYYNDYNAYFPHKARAILALTDSINAYSRDAQGKKRKLVDGVGMQGYIGGYGKQEGCLEISHIGMIKNAILDYAAHGLLVQITEMAVRNYDPAKASAHAHFYAELFRMFASLVREDGTNPLHCVAVWGYKDSPSEPRTTYNFRMNSPYCGLFDENLDCKDAFLQVLDALKK